MRRDLQKRRRDFLASHCRPESSLRITNILADRDKYPDVGYPCMAATVLSPPFPYRPIVNSSSVYFLYFIMKPGRAAFIHQNPHACEADSLVILVTKYLYAGRNEYRSI